MKTLLQEIPEDEANIHFRCCGNGTTTTSNTTINNGKNVTQRCGGETKCIKIVEEQDLEDEGECNTGSRNFNETALVSISFPYCLWVAKCPESFDRNCICCKFSRYMRWDKCGTQCRDTTKCRAKDSFFTTGELLLINENFTLEIPSFNKSEFKFEEISSTKDHLPAGRLYNKVFVCNGSSCNSLQQGKWKAVARMTYPRRGAGSSSDYDRWIVTGGLGYEDDEKLKSTEIFSGGNWTEGPSL